MLGTIEINKTSKANTWCHTIFYSEFTHIHKTKALASTNLIGFLGQSPLSYKRKKNQNQNQQFICKVKFLWYEMLCTTTIIFLPIKNSTKDLSFLLTWSWSDSSTRHSGSLILWIKIFEDTQSMHI